ncbi:hypothetical protein GCM10017576_29070 [Microbacterium barkeri]|uniref:Uncharacterized protein n=2 Tax=Microbacteriaceae TaxID=85023 RepID=A0A9W6H525_9MICO|nr:hypothetical protein GCM10017576_29070 [Microbacterium barkeri]
MSRAGAGCGLYPGAMAIGGRNLAATWIAGLLIVGIIGAILWVAFPSLHIVGDWVVAAVDFFFDWLRSITPTRP